MADGAFDWIVGHPHGIAKQQRPDRRHHRSLFRLRTVSASQYDDADEGERRHGGWWPCRGPSLERSLESAANTRPPHRTVTHTPSRALYRYSNEEKQMFTGQSAWSVWSSAIGCSERRRSSLLRLSQSGGSGGGVCTFSPFCIQPRSGVGSGSVGV